MRSKDEYAQQGTPSLADQWRRHLQAKGEDGGQPVDLELPSGLPVRAGRTNILTLMQRGSIPDALTPRVEALIAAAKAGGADAVQVSMHQDLDENPARFHTRWMALLDAVWMATVVEPRFTTDPQNDPEAIPLDGVSEEDKSFLFIWCQGVTEAVAAFREQRAREGAAVGLGPESGQVRATPGNAGGHRPVA